MLRRSSFSASLQPAHKNSPHWLAEQMLCWANSGRRGKEKTCLSPSVVRKSRYNPSPCGTPMMGGNDRGGIQEPNRLDAISSSIENCSPSRDCHGVRNCCKRRQIDIAAIKTQYSTSALLQWSRPRPKSIRRLNQIVSSSLQTASPASIFNVYPESPTKKPNSDEAVGHRQPINLNDPALPTLQPHLSLCPNHTDSSPFP
jgi:hypothetical protein